MLKCQGHSEGTAFSYKQVDRKNQREGNPLQWSMIRSYYSSKFIPIRRNKMIREDITVVYLISSFYITKITVVSLSKHKHTHTY